MSGSYCEKEEKEHQFCKDVEIRKYNSNALYIYHGKMDSDERIVEKHIMLSDLEELGIKKCIVLLY